MQRVDSPLRRWARAAEGSHGSCCSIWTATVKVFTRRNSGSPDWEMVGNRRCVRAAKALAGAALGACYRGLRGCCSCRCFGGYRGDLLTPKSRFTEVKKKSD